MRTIINKTIARLMQPSTIKTLSCLVVLLLLAAPQLHAQGGGPTDPGSDPSDTGVPIDGGISLLVAAGVGYGAKKMKERKQQLEK